MALLAYNYMQMGEQSKQAGVTLVELMVSLAVFMIIATAFLTLYTTLVRSTILAKRQATALTLATNQMEYLRSLPYDKLAVSGGSIIATSYLPATTTTNLNNAVYNITTSISYVDDAYDGCGNYPSQAVKTQYCRNYSSTTTGTVDTNPADYKIANVTVKDKKGNRLAYVDTQLSAKVAETASTTGALFVTVVDSTGTPLPGATVRVTNSTVSPAVDVSDVSDANGLAIFYGLPFDTGQDYVLAASKANYSSVNTIGVSGSLQPTYPNVSILSQQASSATLPLKQMAANSLLVQTTDVNGAALPNAKIYLKGGYKKYIAASDTQYYYDNQTPSDVRPVSDTAGMIGITNLVPGQYYFCGDNGSVKCTVGSTTYYLAAAVPYSGTAAVEPISVPVYDPSNASAPSFSYNGVIYVQKVQLLLTTSSSFPRITTLSPSVVNSGSNLSSVPFTITGANLPCSSSASSCNTTVRLQQGAASYTASCTGASAGTNLSCTVNLTGASSGGTQLVISTSNGTLTLPANPQLGGITIE